MAYPDKYARSFGFQQYQDFHPDTPAPGDEHDAELDAIAKQLGVTIDFLKTSIRSDGKLANKSVGVDQLAADLQIGFHEPTTYAAGAAYSVNDTVFYLDGFYQANTAHVATDTFNTDYWTLLVDFSAQMSASAASAAAAALSESNAAASASSAASHDTSAASHDTSAAGHDTAAASSASAASTSETNAAASASAASTSETNAAASASSASTSATNANNSAVSASATAASLANVAAAYNAVVDGLQPHSGATVTAGKRYIATDGNYPDGSGGFLAANSLVLCTATVPETWVTLAPAGEILNTADFLFYSQDRSGGTWRAVRGSTKVAGSLANIATMDTAAAAAHCPVHLDSDFTLTANKVYSAIWLGRGGVITTGAFNLTGTFWAPPSTQMFDSATSTGQVNLQGTYHEGWFGSVADGTTDCTTALNRAIRCAAVAGQRAVSLLSGTHIVSAPVVLQGQVHVFGPGIYSCTIKLANGSNCDVVNSNGFDGFSLIRNNNVNPSTSPVRFGLTGVTIDGNRGAQTIGAQGQGIGLAIHGHSYIVDNVRIQNCISIGFYSEYQGNAPITGNYAFGYDHYIGNMIIYNCLGGGLWYYGPNDGVFTGFLDISFIGDSTSGEHNTNIWQKGRALSFSSAAGAFATTSGDTHGARAHCYAFYGLGLYNNAWLRAVELEIETSSGSNTTAGSLCGTLWYLASNGTTQISSISKLIGYNPNQQNLSGVIAAEIVGDNYNIGVLDLRLDAPITGSAPYNSLTGLYLAGKNTQISALTINGSQVSRTTVGLSVQANGARVSGTIYDLNYVDLSNQAVNGSHGVLVGTSAVALRNINLSLKIDNCAVMHRMGTALLTNSEVTINGSINQSTTGQLGFTGNSPASQAGVTYIVGYLDNATNVANKAKAAQSVNTNTATEQTFTFSFNAPWTPSSNDLSWSPDSASSTVTASCLYSGWRSISTSGATFAVKQSSAAGAGSYNANLLLSSAR